MSVYFISTNVFDSLAASTFVQGFSLSFSSLSDFVTPYSISNGKPLAQECNINFN